MFYSIIRFWPYLWPRDFSSARLRFIVAMLSLVGAKVFILVGPIIFRDLINLKFIDQHFDQALYLIALYGLSRIGVSICSEIKDVIFARVTEQAVRMLALDVFKHLHNLSLKFHLQRQTGGLSRIIERGTKSVETMLTFLSFNIVPTIVEVIFLGVILAYLYGWTFAITMIIAIGCYIIYTLKLTEWRIHFVKTMNENDNAAQTKAIDSLLNFETVKYFGNEVYEHERFNESLIRYEDAAVKSKKSLSALNVGQTVIITVGMLANMFLTIRGIQNGELSVGDLVAINTFVLQLYFPLFNLGYAYREIKMGLINLQSLFQLLDETLDVQDAHGASDFVFKGGEIAFKEVHFSYEADREILKGISFTVLPGKSLAIVGPSGSGKSTIARLLFRFYDVTQGSISIDCQNIMDVGQKTLRDSIGMVPQDTVLFNDTIYYNIAYGNPLATRDDIIDAAQKAEIHDFVMSLPQQYETRVGERGLKLSGGEKQRVAIARTLLKNPDILIFDEATSALDTHTEKEIQKNLNEISKDKTTITIAHRLATIVNADEIVVLENGMISERGTHHELIEKGGSYAALWWKQSEKTKVHS